MPVPIPNVSDNTQQTAASTAQGGTVTLGGITFAKPNTFDIVTAAALGVGLLIGYLIGKSR